MADGIDQNAHAVQRANLPQALPYARPALLSPERFVYWLQGFLEVSGVDSIDAEQTRIIKEHLGLCFEHIATTPLQVTPLPFIDTGNHILEPDLSHISVVC